MDSSQNLVDCDSIRDKGIEVDNSNGNEGIEVDNSNGNEGIEVDNSNGIEVIEVDNSNASEDIEVDNSNDDEARWKPETGMCFSCIDDVKTFYGEYALKKGFGWKIRTSRKGDNGEICYLILACSREGSRLSKKSSKTLPSKDKNCPAKICIKLEDDGLWYIKRFESSHSHETSPTKARFFRANRKMNRVKRKIQSNDDPGVRINKTFQSLVKDVGGHEITPFCERDVGNYVNKELRTIGKDNNTRMTELEAEVKRINERMEKYHSELLEKVERMNVKINRITDAFGTLQGCYQGTQSQVKPTKQQLSCILEFGGVSMGIEFGDLNISRGPAGAGALLLAEDGTLLYGFRQGLGYQTKESAEYRALLLGLKHASMKGFKYVTAKGDSELVINQILDPWKIKDEHLKNLCAEALELSDKFHSFCIQHISRERNYGAVRNANRAINLNDGQVEENHMH